jgi:hypothetical protein
MRSSSVQPPPPKKKKAKKRGNWLKVSDVGAAYYKLTNDKVPCEQTVRNWMQKGRLAYDGDRVTLRHVEKHGRFLTKWDWLERFVEALFDESL